MSEALVNKGAAQPNAPSRMTAVKPTNGGRSANGSAICSSADLP